MLRRVILGLLPGRCAGGRLCFLTAAAMLTSLPAIAQIPALSLEPVAGGLDRPLAVTNAGDGRLFITEQSGRIRIFDGKTLLPQPFLDISERVLDEREQGLLSAAFHPNYTVNGWFYVHYVNLQGEVVVSRFSASADPNVALPGSEKILLKIPHPFRNHNGGLVLFGPDGYLYVGIGDGGTTAGQFDPFCSAQDNSTLLGKLLRLDVDHNPNQPPYHGIPADNPFRGPGPPRDEIWAKGLRNPWRFSFDRRTGDLYIGDVGQSLEEEVDLEPAGSAGGRNYGWKVMEGNACTGNTEGCTFGVPACHAPAFTPPIITYGHDLGHAVIGGHVYRGLRIPGLYGHYLYGDLIGTLWAARNVGGTWQTQVLAPTAPSLTSFGESQSGEIYLTVGDIVGDTVYRLVGPPPPTSCTPGPTTLCLQNGRFQVTLTWRSATSDPAAAFAEPLTADSGYFYFINPANPELFVKVLNACVPAFNRYWVFAAGLTNVETSLEVIDVKSGQRLPYYNPLGRAFQPVQDTNAFATCP
jgi:glucose/arabinose dehydrogenase